MMLLRAFLVAFQILQFHGNAHAKLREFVKFKQVEFVKLPDSGNFPFAQYNNVPQGFAPYVKGNKLFIAVPRRFPGAVPSTINYIALENGKSPSDDPKLHSYPSFEMNELDPSNAPNINRIVSVYRPRVDECERLWFVDSGVINTSTGNATIVQRPSIWVIDLKTDKVLLRHEIPASVSRTGAGLASITVDVIDCEKRSFAYMPNLEDSQIVVFNLEQNRSYNFKHNFFHMNPLEGEYNVDGLRFSWDDAIFSIALSPRDPNSTYRLAYFHAMSSFSEFAVSTEVLRNENLAKRSYHGDDFKLIGNRGEKSQSTMHGVHQKTGATFFAEINKNAVSCWNSKSSLRPSNVVEVARDNETLIYPSDLDVVDDDLWVLSNRMIRHLYSKLNADDYNFRVFRTPVNELFKGTKCVAAGKRPQSSRRRTQD